ncbi:hypothetical protein ACROYT_G031851 [Oculina patagonica]
MYDTVNPFWNSATIEANKLRSEFDARAHCPQKRLKASMQAFSVGTQCVTLSWTPVQVTTGNIEFQVEYRLERSASISDCSDWLDSGAS